MIRAVGLRSAVAINVATMVGAGPFITLPLIVAALHGSVSALGWVTGALIALCDGLVWAELASRYPRSGGTYTYLRESFGPRGPGRFLAFLFVWQYLFWAPLILASGYIGFAQYAAYLVPALGGFMPTHLLAMGLGAVTLVSLYRPIPQVARTALVLGGVALVTLLAVALAGLSHPYAPLAQTVPMTFSVAVGVVALGNALVITLYDYSGYGDVCALGDEVIAPVRTIPRAIVLSVLFVGAAYVLLNLGVAAAIPAKEIATSNAIASLVAERAFGAPFAIAVTLAVMLTAFASTYGLLLGASRIPFAAAREGDFLPAFARLHPSGKFPHVSLIAIGLLALPASLLPLDAVINALTAGIVLIQGVGQIVALAVSRARGPAPFRIPLYPLPPLIALVGWLFLFWSTGAVPVAFGLATLAAGALVFLVRARAARSWPFAALLALAVLAAPPAAVAAPAFGHAVIAQRDGEPTLLLDGKPFFFWGAAFFYERLPATQWRTSMLALRDLGANTLDLYVPWNWHETADGEFDFDGHTNPRRNLREVLRLGKELGFAFIVRPGPVIRNEWRNGGYPAWLLTRPEYGMPLHDVLEGRYPATATLQNAHSDDAAAEWLANPTHLRYAARWLRRALAEFRPVADRVLAVQLDDDQGAYMDNQTYPAPNLTRYLRWLEAQARDVVGPATPAFINTYQMRVPASSPVWTMGNWYQSEAYAIGEHDRVQLDLSTAMLRTNRLGPAAVSEFQAGWLAQPEDPQPRAVDPQNTELALYELLSWGVRGVVDFPMQDTLAPFGWEAPFSNALYAWDAALRYPAPQSLPGSRYEPTRRFGEAVSRYGALLAEARRVSDVALAYPASTYPGDPAAASAALTRFRERLRECGERGTPCEVVDLASTGAARLRAFRTLIVDDEPTQRAHAALLQTFARRGGIVTATVPAQHLPGTLLRGPNGTLLVAVNWSSDVMRFRGGPLQYAGARYALPAFEVPARSGRLIPLGVTVQPPAVARSWGAALSRAEAGRDVRLAPATTVSLAGVHAPDGAPETYRADAFEDGSSAVVLQNAVARVVVVPDGGARVPVFALLSGGANAFDATGALRDDVLVPPPPSATDRIAKYTHSYPAGTFNRAYGVAEASGGSVRLTADVPDAAPGGVRFERNLTLVAGAARLVVDERVTFAAGPQPERQRGVVLSALAVGTPAAMTAGPLDAPRGTFAIERRGEGDWLVLAVSWRTGDVESAAWAPHRSNGTLRLVLPPGWHRVTYALARVATREAALAFVEAERAWVAANPGSGRG